MGGHGWVRMGVGGCMYHNMAGCGWVWMGVGGCMYHNMAAQWSGRGGVWVQNFVYIFLVKMYTTISKSMYYMLFRV